VRFFGYPYFVVDDRLSRCNTAKHEERVMTIIVRHEGDGADMEPLNFELAGMMHMPEAMGRDANAVYSFMQRGHPRHMHKPGLVLSVAPTLKAQGRNDIPFGVFFATAEANPDSTRPLMSRSELKTYRLDYPVLSFNQDWESWEQVSGKFPPNASSTDEGYDSPSP
jgi:hypothetical protein